MDTHTRRSRGGYINFVNDGAVSWKSRLQGIVTLSSCEDEYIALCSEVCEVRYLRWLLRSLGFKQRESTVIWENNRSTILIAENECSSAGRSKHIDIIRFKFVAQSIPDNIVRVRYTPTQTYLADILTTTSPRTTFERLRDLCRGSKLGNYYLDEQSERERVIVYDTHTWMTTSVYSAMVGMV